MLVDAHGGPDGIFLSQGAPDKAGNLTVSVRNTYVSTYDVALAFEKRYDNGITDVPIFIYSACYSQDFIRGLNEYLSTINSKKNKNIHMPIAMGETEYGQQGFSAVTESDGSEYGAKFFKLIFEGGNPSTSHTVRFKDVIQVEAGQRHLKMPSNISIFVPFEQKQDKAKKRPRHTYYQIAQADTKTEREYDIHKIDGVKQEIDEIISART